MISCPCKDELPMGYPEIPNKMGHNITSMVRFIFRMWTSDKVIFSVAVTYPIATLMMESLISS